MPRLILVTGAAGNTGQAIIRALVGSGASVRALVRRSEQQACASEAGAQQVVVGDMRSPSMMEKAVGGAASVYHIPPNVSPDEVVMGQTVMTAAQVAGVQHFVFHSVLHPQTQAMPHHWHKLRVEEMLFESGLPFTILQPAAYMQNILAHWTQAKRKGIYPVPYRTTARLSLVDLEDVAAAAVRVLTQSGHVGATYELAHR